MRRLYSIFLIVFIVPILMGANSYNYTYWGEAIHSAPGMTFAASINSEELGVLLASPEDLVVFEDNIYLVDSDTSSLIVIDSEFNLVDEITVFDLTEAYENTLNISSLPETMLEYSCPDIDYEYNGETCEHQTDPLASEMTPVVSIIGEMLNGPLGIDVTESGIFICDTGNYRIVKLNHDFEVVDTFSDIDDPTFDEISFEPAKITVDSTDRMYVVAKNVYEGIMEINYDGSFNRFTGVNPITLTPFEIFSRALMSEAQIAKLQLFLPTEYTNVNIDDRNFIYATSKVSDNNNENPIQLINPKGIDVIKKNGYFPPMGDVIYVNGSNNYVIEGPSSLVDIAETNDGIYTVLDQKRSRLFTYDSEGNLLYIDGDEGKQTDKFSEGVAIGYLNDDLLILDRGTKTIVVYTLTEFGSYVNQAIHYHNEGMFTEAAGVWEEVITINSNYEIAYNGIGKLLLRQGEFRQAMDYFELGHDDYYYSKAYKEYRNQILEENFGLILSGIIVLGGTIVGLRIRKVYKKGGSILYED